MCIQQIFLESVDCELNKCIFLYTLYTCQICLFYICVCVNIRVRAQAKRGFCSDYCLFTRMALPPFAVRAAIDVATTFSIYPLSAEKMRWRKRSARCCSATAASPTGAHTLPQPGTLVRSRATQTPPMAEYHPARPIKPCTMRAQRALICRIAQRRLVMGRLLNDGGGIMRQNIR